LSFLCPEDEGNKWSKIKKGKNVIKLTAKKTLFKALSISAATMSLAACTTPASMEAVSEGAAKVDLRVSVSPSPNEIYEARSEFQVPPASF